MPKFSIRRTETQELVVEAPDARTAAWWADEIPSYDWGYADERIRFLGPADVDAVIDVTADLQELRHAHAYEDEDTGGCIYCDAPAPTGDEAGA